MPRAALVLVVLLSCTPRGGPAAPVESVAPSTVGSVPALGVLPLPRDDNRIAPCPTTSPEAAAAKRALDALSPRVEALGASDSPTALAGEIRSLVDSPCFALTLQDESVALKWATGLSLRTWWREGGRDWLAHYLAFEPNPGRFIVATPPTPRRALTLEIAPPKDPLRPLLCSAKAIDDHSCGTETSGWRSRAEGAPQAVTAARDRGAACAELTRNDTSGASPYAIFRRCLDDGERVDAMPLGVFQAPKDGWFVVAHSVFITYAECRDNAEAYDLATGAAYLVKCMPSPPARLAVGRVPLAALREAAWMVMLQQTAESGVRTQGHKVDLPAGMTIERRRGESVQSRRVIISTSDMPWIDFAWLRGKPGALAGQASGRFDTAESALSAHAAKLLRAVEGAFQEGCAPAQLPRVLPWNDLGPSVTPEGGPGAGGPLQFVHRAKVTLANAPRSPTPCPIIP